MPPSPSEHATLVVAVAQQRDRAAFAVLFDYYAPRINAYLLRMRADTAAAEEITQDVMLTLWRKAEQFDPAKSSLTTWLYRIARNRRIDVLRRNRVEFHDPADFALDLADESVGDAGAGMDAQQRAALLKQAVADLPEDQRALVKLAFFDGLTHSDIAAKTSLPLGTVKSRIRLAFSRLRRALEAGGVTETE